MGGEDLLAGLLVDTVRKRELEVLGEELLDVGAADISGLLDLDDLKNLDIGSVKNRGLWETSNTPEST